MMTCAVQRFFSLFLLNTFFTQQVIDFTLLQSHHKISAMQLQLPQLFIQLVKEIKDTILAGNGVCNEKLYSTLHHLHEKYDSVIKSGAMDKMATGCDIPSQGSLHISSFFFGIALGLVIWSMYNMYRKNQMAVKRNTLSPVVEECVAKES